MCVSLVAAQIENRERETSFLLSRSFSPSFILIMIPHSYYHCDRASAGASALTRGVGLSPGARNATQAASSRARTAQ